MRRSFWLCTVFGALLGTSGYSVAQDNWWRLGGVEGRSWESVTDFSLMVDDSSVAGAIQPWELKPDQNVLAKLEFWQRWRFPTDSQYRAGHPRLWTDINHNSIYQSTEVFSFVDGDLTTHVERRDQEGIFYTIDMGAQLPVDRFVFFPPEGVSLETHEPFRPNYVLKSYNLTASRNETGMLQEELERGFQWLGEEPCCPLGTRLAQEERNSDSITEITFPLQPFRYFRLIAVPDGFTLYGEPIVTRSAFAEMEVYGRGFAPRATWESTVVDLGQEVNFGRVVFAASKWRKEGEQLISATDAQVVAKVEIRTGRDDTPTAYFGFNDLGKPIEVDKSQWDRLIPLESRGSTVAVGYRGPVAEDQNNWSFWSLPLEESGEHPGMPWGRYFQLRIQLETESVWDYVRMDSLWIEIAPLLADRVLGEVVTLDEFQPQGGRVKVRTGEVTKFVYELGAEFSHANRAGFDVLRVLTPGEGTFLWLEMGDSLERVEPDSVVSGANSFTVYLPRRMGPEGDHRLRIGLESVLYGEAGAFGGEVFERKRQGLLQKVEGGDASAELGSNQLLIVASASSTGGVLGQMEVIPRVFTPQGDGINDRIQISYTLFRVFAAARVEVGIFSLGGKRVRRIRPEVQGAGRHEVMWDGRDDAGSLVEPGIYLARVNVDTDQGSVDQLRTIAVAY